MRVLFVYDVENEHIWHDGLRVALELLGKEKEVQTLTMLNLHTSKDAHDKHSLYKNEYDYVLGWGGFGSSVDKFLQEKHLVDPVRKGLCLGGYVNISANIATYETIFYECEWGKRWIQENHYVFPNLIHAFGVNTRLYAPLDKNLVEKVYDFLSVGAFAIWKRYSLLAKKKGIRLAVGEIQKNNLSESFSILHDLILNNVIISDSVHPKTLTILYNQSKVVYIPANELGGGERAILEARACGIPVEIEEDNDKLKELLTSPIWDEKYYARQLEKGILL